MADAPENTSESTARDYRDTVFLPETPFPMRGGLPQKEPVILEQWGDLYGTLRAERQKQNAPSTFFTTVRPTPTATSTSATP